MNAHHSDSMTKAAMPNYEPSQMVSVMAQQKTLLTLSPHTSIPIYPELFTMQDPVKKWCAVGDKGNVPAQGTYTYDTTCGAHGNLQTDIVNYSITIHGARVWGTTEDSIGTAEISGNIDRNRGSICFLKKYVRTNKKKRVFVWEYAGCFTPCGIVGEWHHPGDPAEVAHWRGKFSIWLREDEGAGTEELEDRLRTLITSGKLLARSMTGVSARH